MFYRKKVLLLLLGSCFCVQSAMMPVDDIRLKREFKLLANSTFTQKKLKTFKEDLDRHQDYIRYLVDIVEIGFWLSRLQDNGFGFALDENDEPTYISTTFLGSDFSVQLIPMGNVNRNDLIALKNSCTSVVIPNNNPLVIAHYLRLYKLFVNGENVKFKGEAETLFNNNPDPELKRLIGALLHIFFSQKLSEKLVEIDTIKDVVLESDTPYWNEPYRLLVQMHDHCFENKVAEVFMDRSFRMLLKDGQLMLKRIFEDHGGVSIYGQYEILNDIISEKMGAQSKHIDNKPAAKFFSMDISIDSKPIFEKILLTPEQIKLLPPKPNKKAEQEKLDVLAAEIEAMDRKKAPKKTPKGAPVQAAPKKVAKKEAKPVPAKPVPAKPVPAKLVPREEELEGPASFLEGWQVKGPKYRSARHDQRVFERQAQTREQELVFNQIYHDYPLEFDGLIQHTGVQKTRPSSTRPGQNDTQYMLGGMIRYPDGTVETVVYSITKGFDGLIYHRGVERMNANDFVTQYSRNNAWVTAFPDWSEGGVDNYASFARDHRSQSLFERREDSYCVYMRNKQSGIEYIIYKRDTRS